MQRITISLLNAPQNSWNPKPDTIKAHIWVNYCGSANNSHTGHTSNCVYMDICNFMINRIPILEVNGNLSLHRQLVMKHETENILLYHSLIMAKVKLFQPHQRG
jgi:hypothetical protein